jgi:hypothetical protein
MTRLHTRFSLTLQDGLSLTESCTAYVSLEETLSPEDRQAAFNRWAERVAAVSDGKIVAARVGSMIVAAGAPDQPDKPVAGSSIAETCLLRFAVQGVANRSWSLAVPAVARTLAARGGRIDQTNPALLALVEEMSMGGAGYSFTNPNSLPLGRLSALGRNVRPGSARRQLRTRRRALSRSDESRHLPQPSEPPRGSDADLGSLTPFQFEQRICRLLRDCGYTDVRHTGGSGDLCVDVACSTPQGQIVMVQCKRYTGSNKVGSKEVQTFVGMTHRYHRTDKTLYITTSGYTPAATQLARELKITLLNGHDLTRLLPEAEEAARAGRFLDLTP